MCQSTDEEAAGFKDRERRRSSSTNSRQNLGAVGRVASRVRKSGMLTKANSLLQRQKEDERTGVNESPWGVGISVVAQEEEKTSLEVRNSADSEKGNNSPRARRRSDMVELSSPLSADHNSVPRLSEIRKREQSDTKEDGSSRMDRKGERTASDRRTEKKTERVSIALGSGGTARGLVKSVSRFGLRGNDRRANTQSPQNSLAKSRSTLTVNDIKEARPRRLETGKGTSETPEDIGRQRSSIKDYDSPITPTEVEAMPDTRIRGFHFPVLGRGRSRQDDLALKTKVKEKLRAERPRAKSAGPIRSVSQIAIKSPKAAPYETESRKNDSDSGKSDDGKRIKNRKSFKDYSDQNQKLRKGRANWFGFSGEPGDSQTRGTMQSRSKLKARQERSSAEYDPESELGSRVSVKASKDLAEIQDFAIDEYFDSEEDDMESESAPPSIAEDDFITYQTGKGKKAQGNRSRIRMKSQT